MVAVSAPARVLFRGENVVHRSAQTYCDSTVVLLGQIALFCLVLCTLGWMFLRQPNATSCFVVTQCVTAIMGLNAYLWYASALLRSLHHALKTTEQGAVYVLLGVLLYGQSLLIPLTLLRW